MVSSLGKAVSKTKARERRISRCAPPISAWVSTPRLYGSSPTGSRRKLANGSRFGRGRSLHRSSLRRAAPAPRRAAEAKRKCPAQGRAFEPEIRLVYLAAGAGATPAGAAAPPVEAWDDSSFLRSSSARFCSSSCSFLLLLEHLRIDRRAIIRFAEICQRNIEVHLRIDLILDGDAEGGGLLHGVDNVALHLGLAEAAVGKQIS